MKTAFRFTQKALFVPEKYKFWYFPPPLFFALLTVAEFIEEPG